MWDLKGKLLAQPVYDLLGGPVRSDIECYATGNDTDWILEQGFQATKIACPYGPADGAQGLEANEAVVQATRQLIGADRDLMVDCWMAFDVDYAVQFAQRIQLFGIGRREKNWIEINRWRIKFMINLVNIFCAYLGTRKTCHFI